MPNGEQCKARALRSSHRDPEPVCHFHSLTKAEMVAVASKGGSTPIKYTLRLPRVTSYEACQEAIAIVTEALANGHITEARGLQLHRLLSLWLEAHQAALEEAREADRQARYDRTRARQGATP